MLINFKNKNLLIILLLVLVIASCFCFSSIKKEGFSNNETDFSKYFNDGTSDLKDYIESKSKSIEFFSDIKNRADFDNYKLAVLIVNSTYFKNLSSLDKLESSGNDAAPATLEYALYKLLFSPSNLYKIDKINQDIGLTNYKFNQNIEIDLHDGDSSVNYPRFVLLVFIKDNKLYDTNLEDNKVLENLSLNINGKNIVKNGLITETTNTETSTTDISNTETSNGTQVEENDIEKQYLITVSNHTHSHLGNIDSNNGAGNNGAGNNSENNLDSQNKFAISSMKENIYDTMDEMIKGFSDLSNNDIESIIINNKKYDRFNMNKISNEKVFNNNNNNNNNNENDNNSDKLHYEDHRNIDNNIDLKKFLLNKNIKNNHKQPTNNSFESIMNEPTNPIVNPINSMNPIEYSQTLFKPCITPSMCKNSMLNGNIQKVNTDDTNNTDETNNTDNTNNANNSLLPNDKSITNNEKMQQLQFKNSNINFKNFPNLISSTDKIGLPRPVLTDFSRFGI
tara:strand:+ start:50 stop:1573 length:1524 start_codon:yes stop_codon:yes gene_type:complete